MHNFDAAGGLLLVPLGLTGDDDLVVAVVALVVDEVVGRDLLQGEGDAWRNAKGIVILILICVYGFSP